MSETSCLADLRPRVASGYVSPFRRLASIVAALAMAIVTMGTLVAVPAVVESAAPSSCSIAEARQPHVGERFINATRTFSHVDTGPVRSGTRSI